MIGTFLGWQACLIAFFIAPLAGLVIGISQLILRRDDVIPYGPFLCLGAAGTVVFWAPIWVWAEPFFAAGVRDVMPPGVQAPAWLQPFFGAGSLVILIIAVCLVMLGVMLWIWRMIKTALFGEETADE
jgi:leader peptidase (prepilin peptidase) / N-methyltransferase